MWILKYCFVEFISKICLKLSVIKVYVAVKVNKGILLQFMNSKQ